jgi:membrane protein implicated in regulation of membrane protease activity
MCFRDCTARSLDSAGTRDDASPVFSRESTAILTLAYLALTVVGCVYILFSLIAGHAHFGDTGSHDAGPAHESHMEYGVGGHGSASASHTPVQAAFHFPFFSPLALATLFGAIGAYGLIAVHGFHAGETSSLLLAVPLALLTSYLVTYAGFKLVAGSRGSSVIQLSSLPGARAEVITPIPAGGVGEVAALVDGQRFTGAAREQDGKDVPRGAHVTVKAMVGTTLVVSKEG